MMNGLRYNQQYFNSLLYTEIFFMFVRILHEFSHACIIASGRKMSKHNSKRFHTPTTHCLQGNAGWTMERLFFGSRIDTSGYTIDDKFILQYLTFYGCNTIGCHRSRLDQFIRRRLVKSKQTESHSKY